MKQFFLILLLLISCPLTGSAERAPPPVNDVFNITASYTSHRLQLHIFVANGYYLYKDKIKITLLSPSDHKLKPIGLPKGEIKKHQILGTFEAYKHPITLTIPLTHLTNANLAVNYQGCAESGFCYPPQTRYITLANNQIRISNPDEAAATSEQDKITQLLSSQNYAWILLGFLGFGLLLAFTPCVFPMLPILSGIIIGQEQQLTTRKAFQLSITYVLAMAITYAIAGVAAAYAGGYIQGMLQKPWIIALFSSFFVLLALSLFGLYELQLPATWQQKLTQLSNKQQSGRYLGVALMGCLSTLIVSPCVSAPLIGALGYISQTGNVMLGGVALFTLGLGMGIPLLIIGTSAGKLLPKAGAWMQTIKQIFGLMLIGLAIWLLSRIISSYLSLALWTSLCLGSSFYLKAFQFRNRNRWQRFNQLIGLGLFCISLGLGSELLLKTFDTKLSLIHTLNSNPQQLDFQPIHNQTELIAAIQKAELANKPVILDFYADWCISCKTMEKTVLAKPGTQNLLQNFVRLKIDITNMDNNQQQLLQSLEVVAPPTFLFFKQGREAKQYRIVGEVTSATFNNTLELVRNEPEIN